MGFWKYVIWGIALIVSYYFIPFLYYLLILIMALNITFKIYRWYDRRMNPGKRIRHSMLRNYMINKYGKDDGVKTYRDTVSELRKKGYK